MLGVLIFSHFIVCAYHIHCMHVFLILFQKAKEKKDLAQAKSKEIEVQNKVIAKEKSEAEAALAEALPALEEARLALSDLDKSDVTEIR